MYKYIFSTIESHEHRPNNFTALHFTLISKRSPVRGNKSETALIKLTNPYGTRWEHRAVHVSVRPNDSLPRTGTQTETSARKMENTKPRDNSQVLIRLKLTGMSEC